MSPVLKLSLKFINYLNYKTSLQQIFILWTNQWCIFFKKYQHPNINKSHLKTNLILKKIMKKLHWVQVLQILFSSIINPQGGGNAQCHKIVKRCYIMLHIIKMGCYRIILMKVANRICHFHKFVITLIVWQYLPVGGWKKLCGFTSMALGTVSTPIISICMGTQKDLAWLIISRVFGQ